MVVPLLRPGSAVDMPPSSRGPTGAGAGHDLTRRLRELRQTVYRNPRIAQSGQACGHLERRPRFPGRRQGLQGRAVTAQQADVVRKTIKVEVDEVWGGPVPADGGRPGSRSGDALGID